MNFNFESYKIRITIFLIVMGGLVYAGFSTKLSAQDINTIEWKVLLQTLAVFFILALFIERCVEVLVNYLFGVTEAKINSPVLVALLSAELKQKLIETSISSLDTPEQKVAYLNELVKNELADVNQAVVEKYEKSREELQKLKVPKEAVAILIAVLIGLAVAASGFRILSMTLCAVQTGGNCTFTAQTLMFKTTDLLVSSLLLAGGADGIHQIIRRIFGPSGELDNIVRRVGANPVSAPTAPSP